MSIHGQKTRMRYGAIARAFLLCDQTWKTAKRSLHQHQGQDTKGSFACLKQRMGIIDVAYVSAAAAVHYILRVSENTRQSEQAMMQ